MMEIITYQSGLGLDRAGVDCYFDHFNPNSRHITVLRGYLTSNVATDSALKAVINLGSYVSGSQNYLV